MRLLEVFVFLPVYFLFCCPPVPEERDREKSGVIFRVRKSHLRFRDCQHVPSMSFIVVSLRSNTLLFFLVSLMTVASLVFINRQRAAYIVSFET